MREPYRERKELRQVCLQAKTQREAELYKAWMHIVYGTYANGMRHQLDRAFNELPAQTVRAIRDRADDSMDPVKRAEQTAGQLLREAAALRKLNGQPRGEQ